MERCACGIFVAPAVLNGCETVRICVPPWGEHVCPDRMTRYDAEPDVPFARPEDAGKYLRYLLTPRER